MQIFVPLAGIVKQFPSSFHLDRKIVRKEISRLKLVTNFISKRHIHKYSRVRPLFAVVHFSVTLDVVVRRWSPDIIVRNTCFLGESSKNLFGERSNH